MLNIISTKKLHITYEVKIIAIHLFRLYHELIAKSMSVSNGTATFSFLVYGAYYSVFKKEGNKVNAYYTNKKGIFGSTMRFFATTT